MAAFEQLAAGQPARLGILPLHEMHDSDRP
jgi:hypothetical protein